MVSMGRALEVGFLPEATNLPDLQVWLGSTVITEG
jgi:hypothetical protein